MDEYIKKEKVLNILCTVSAPTPTESWIVEKCIEKVNEVDTADVAPVRHARWVYDSYTERYRCSNCEAYQPYDESSGYLDYWDCDYCPICGARMDLEISDD
jgi:hypothetical protein